MDCRVLRPKIFGVLEVQVGKRKLQERRKPIQRSISKGGETIGNLVSCEVPTLACGD